MLQPIRDNIKAILAIGFLLVLCFPEIEPVTEIGLDPSYRFAINYFFAHKIQAGNEFIFTYGPLGFIRFPQLIGYNYFITVAFITTVYALFLWILYEVISTVKKAGLWFYILAAGLLTANIRIDEVLIGIVAFSCLLHFYKKHFFWLAIAAVITALSFLIKINIAASSLLIILSYLFFDLLKYKGLKPVLYCGLAGLGTYVISWLLIYHNLNGIVPHLKNWLFISNGNLGATSINVNNNKLILGGMFLAMILLFFRYKSANIALIFMMFGLALWGVFKYSMAREENYHALAFFNMLLLFLSAILFTQKSISLTQLGCMFLIPFLYYQNILQTEHFNISKKIQWGNTKHFYNTFINHENYLQQCKNQTKNNLAPHVLPDTVLRIVGKQTVDVFPWEISYVAANKLNYRNRPLIQLGCVNNYYIDSLNANFLKSEEAPRFIIWTKQNWFGKEMSSIDNRYILNDDGQTIFSLLNSYRSVYEDEKICLLERQQTNRCNTRIEKKSIVKWNEWIAVENHQQPCRVKFKIDKTWYGQFKHFFYKEAEYYMEYKLEDETIQQHRLVVQNTESGIWVSPYVESFNNNLQGKNVKDIKFIFTDNVMAYKPQIHLTWELIVCKEK